MVFILANALFFAAYTQETQAAAGGVSFGGRVVFMGTTSPSCNEIWIKVVGTRPISATLAGGVLYGYPKVGSQVLGIAMPSAGAGGCPPFRVRLLGASR